MFQMNVLPVLCCNPMDWKRLCGIAINYIGILTWPYCAIYTLYSATLGKRHRVFCTYEALNDWYNINFDTASYSATVVISFTLPHKYKYIYNTKGQLAEYNYDCMYSYRIVDKEYVVCSHQCRFPYWGTLKQRDWTCGSLTMHSAKI